MGGDMDEDGVDQGEEWGEAAERTNKRMYIVKAQEKEGEDWVGKKHSN